MNYADEIAKLLGCMKTGFCGMRRRNIVRYFIQDQDVTRQFAPKGHSSKSNSHQISSVIKYTLEIIRE